MNIKSKPNNLETSITITKAIQLLRDIEDLSPKEFLMRYGGKMKIKKVDSKAAISIIEKAEPRGLFYYKFGNLYIGIDNSIGYAWTRKFKKHKNCRRWLLRN